MNTVADAPVPGLAPEQPLVPEAVVAAAATIAAVVTPVVPATAWAGTKDVLVSIYAYGLLAFGMLFPIVLAAWYVITKPVVGS